MKTLRAKLFFNVGAILLLVAILNIVLAEVWIRRSVDEKGGMISQYVEEINTKIEQFSSFLITMRLVEKGASLERVAYITASQQTEPPNLWKEAEQIVSYDPEIAFVQVSKDKSALITPEDAPLHPFSYAVQGEDVWAQVEGKEGVFKGKKIDSLSQGVYVLVSTEMMQPSLSFQSVGMTKINYQIEDSVPKLFNSLLTDEMQWVYKIDLIEAMLAFYDKEGFFPLGAIKIAKEGQEGGCIWSSEVFSEKPYLHHHVNTDFKELFLLQRKGDLDVVRQFSTAHNTEISLGFSLSHVLQYLAALSKRTVFILADGVHMGISPSGEIFDYIQEGYQVEEGTSSRIVKGSEQYVPFFIDFSLFKVALLTPKAEAFAIISFLEQLGHELIINVALSLIGAACISFIIALILLKNISRKITQPIAQLSEAASHLGDGRYADIRLPAVEHRQDEVANLTHSFAGMVEALQDRDKIRGVLHKVVSKEISDEILKRNMDFAGEERVLTLLFSDIRNFTKMAEGLSPRALINMLNLYMTRMCQIIDATHGVVDKFVGDEIMTLYGAPLPLEGHAVFALEAAIAMIEDLTLWNSERKREGLPTFTIGIGIHTGLVYTGNMGAENRLNYTAIGSNVNLASRVCSAAAPMQILVTQQTLESPGVQEKFRFRAVDPIALKGIEHPVTLYEIIGRVS